MKIILLLASLLTMGPLANSQSPYQFYYLAIGSAHYERDPSKIGVDDYAPQSDIESATTSTLIMQQLFEKNIKAKGVTVISTEDSLVTRKRVLNEMDKLVAQIKKDKAINPFIIFYYCGHGALDKESNIQMLLPGDYAIDLVKRKTYPNSTNIVANKVLQIQEINDYFADKHYEYMLLVECCRQQLADVSGAKAGLDILKNMTNRLIDSLSKDSDSEEEDVLEAKRENEEGFEEEFLGLKVISQFKQANPIVFATIPGLSTATVQIPKTKFVTFKGIDLTSEIGPLCRRSIIAVDIFLQSSKPVYLIKDYIANLLDKNLDKGSTASNSGYVDNTEHARGVALIRR